MNTLKIIHVARRELGLDDATYRALLQRVTGKDSLRAMTEQQKLAVLDELKAKGFRIRASKAAKSLPRSFKGHSRLIHALWKSCYLLGVVDSPSRESLRAFCKRFVAHAQDGVVVDPDLLSHEQATPIIEALKKMEGRGRAMRDAEGAP